ncbi:hypothetical protein [Kibdelosporangium aridum]|nr:hypothetical protein [Kibdelosporangium aridum]
MVLFIGLIVWGIAMGAWAVAESEFATYHVFLTAVYGLLVPYSAGTFPKRIKAAFPPGTSIDEKMLIWRIVRNGGPIDDPAMARAIAHHARWRLNPRSNTTAATTASFVAPVLVVHAIHSDSANNPAAYVLAGAMVVAAIPFSVLSARQRKTAARVNDQAFQLYAAKSC